MIDYFLPQDFPKHLLHPKHWGSWFVAGIFFLIVKILPYSFLMKIGNGLGLVAAKLMPYRMLIAKTNIKLCFENNPHKDWETIYHNHIRSLGKGILEMSMGWFLDTRKLNITIEHKGLEFVENAKKQGKGILFLGMHTTSLDFGGPLLNSCCEVIPVYQQARNPVLDYIISRSRLSYCPAIIERRNMREILVRLKNGESVWYGCDQDFGLRTKSVFASFYGVPAYTLPYYAKIAQKTGAAVIPVTGLRDEKNNRYVVSFLPEIDITDISDQEAAEEDVYPPKPSHIRRQRKEEKRLNKLNKPQ